MVAEGRLQLESANQQPTRVVVRGVIRLLWLVWLGARSVSHDLPIWLAMNVMILEGHTTNVQNLLLRDSFNFQSDHLRIE